MPDLKTLPFGLQMAIFIGGGGAAFAFIFLVLWSQFASRFGLTAEKSLKEIINVVGPKPDTPESEQEAENPTTLVGVVKKIERNVADFAIAFKAHVRNDDIWQNKYDGEQTKRDNWQERTTREIAAVKKEIGLTKKRNGRVQ